MKRIKRSCALIWSTFTVTIIVLVMGTAASWAHYADLLSEQVAERQKKIMRYQRQIEELPILRAQLAQLHSHTQLRRGSYRAATSDLAAARIQQELKALAEVAEARLVSTQSLPRTGDEAIARIGVRAELQARLPALLELLLEIESAEPFLFVERLDIRSITPRSAQSKRRLGASRRVPPQAQGLLVARLELSAYVSTLE